MKPSLAHVKDGTLDSDDGDIMAPADYLPPSHLKYIENYLEWRVGTDFRLRSLGDMQSTWIMKPNSFSKSLIIWKSGSYKPSEVAQRNTFSDVLRVAFWKKGLTKDEPDAQNTAVEYQGY